MRLCGKKKDREYMLMLQHELKLYAVIDKDEGDGWFTTLLGTTVRQFAEDKSGVLRLYVKGKSCIAMSRLVFNSKSKNLLIGDIESRVENKGYGSKILKSVIKIGQQLEVLSITGNLSHADSDHFDKLEHFYKKHGFTVTLDSNRTTGKIILRLDS